MKKPWVSIDGWKPARDHQLERILRRCGAYYHSAEFFYHELWKQRLLNIGFRVLRIEKLPYHNVWDVKVCGNLAAQTYLLITKPVPAKLAWANDPLPKLFQAEIGRIAKELGCPIKRDCISVARTGVYFRAGFIWPLGKPGSLLKQEKKIDALSFLIRPWLRKNRN
jgi:hypothetical protein